LRQGTEGDLRQHEDEPQEGEEADREGVVLQAVRFGGQRRNRLNETHET